MKLNDLSLKYNYKKLQNNSYNSWYIKQIKLSSKTCILYNNIFISNAHVPKFILWTTLLIDLIRSGLRLVPIFKMHSNGSKRCTYSSCQTWLDYKICEPLTIIKSTCIWKDHFIYSHFYWVFSLLCLLD